MSAERRWKRGDIAVVSFALGMAAERFILWIWKATQ